MKGTIRLTPEELQNILRKYIRDTYNLPTTGKYVLTPSDYSGKYEDQPILFYTKIEDKMYSLENVGMEFETYEG